MLWSPKMDVKVPLVVVWFPGGQAVVHTRAGVAQADGRFPISW